MAFKNLHDDLYQWKARDRKLSERKPDDSSRKKSSVKRNSSSPKSLKNDQTSTTNTNSNDQTSDKNTTISDANSYVSQVSDVFGIIKPKNELVNYVYYDAIVSNVESPSLFWVQMKPNSTKISSLSIDLKLENRTWHHGERWTDFLFSKSDFYNQDVLRDYAIETPVVNTLCVARFSDDGNWYRAKIIHVYPNGTLHKHWLERW